VIITAKRTVAWFMATMGSVLLLLFVALAAYELKPGSEPAAHPWNPVATFSILGLDPDTGEIGAAVQSRVFSVGNGVLWAEAGVGAVATQAIVDVSYGPKGIELLKKGIAPKEVLKRILDSDPDPRPADWSKLGRQFAVINARGEVAAYPGSRATPWAGDRQGRRSQRSATGPTTAKIQVASAPRSRSSR
jgi:hypothetical protein